MKTFLTYLKESIEIHDFKKGPLNVEDYLKKYKDDVKEAVGKLEEAKKDIIKSFSGKTILVKGKLAINRYSEEFKLNILYPNGYYLYFNDQSELFAGKFNGSLKDFIEIEEIINIHEPKIILSKEDPYGEEDWIEENYKIFEQNSDDPFTEEEKKRLMANPDKFFNDKLNEYKKNLLKDIEKVFIGNEYRYTSYDKRRTMNKVDKIRLSSYNREYHDTRYGLVFLEKRKKKKKYYDTPYIEHSPCKKFEPLDNYRKKIEKIKEFDPYGEEIWNI